MNVFAEYTDHAALKAAVRDELDLHLRAYETNLDGRDAQQEEARRQSLASGIAHRVIEGER